LNQKHAKKSLQVEKDAHKPKINDQKIVFLRPKRRSYRTSGSFSSSSNGTFASSEKANFYHYDKYDIDNILIPTEMINNNCKIDQNLIRPVNVKVPKWRINDFNENFDQKEVRITEDLSDETFMKRHELAELRERYHVICKNIEMKRKNDTNKISTNNSAYTTFNRELFDKENNIESLNLDEFKLLVQRLESDCQRKRLISCSIALSKSLPANNFKEALEQNASENS
jgi:hypothetical protein